MKHTPLDETHLRRMFVVLGIDGSGKSTLLQRLKAERPDWEIGSYQPEDWLPHPKLPHFEWEVRRHPKTVMHELKAPARAAFLLHMMVTHFEYWVRPRLEQGKVVVMDSYYYRFAAKERVRDWVPGFFYEGLKVLPHAGHVLFLDLPPETAARRRERFDVHEVQEKATAADFVAFQGQVLEQLEALLEPVKDRVIRIDASASPAQVSASVQAAIAARL